MTSQTHDHPVDHAADHRDEPLQPGSLPELPPPDSGGSEHPWQNDNHFFNRLGAAQNIPFGDWERWYKCGFAPQTGASGQAACDGWTHRYKMARPQYREGVVANLCDTRRFFYAGAPHRQYGPPYPPAGRPDGWTPEIVDHPDPRLQWDDQPDGSVIRPRVRDGVPLQVTSPDVEHVWLTHLFELVDDPSPKPLNTHYGEPIMSNSLARTLCLYVMRSIAGQIRDPKDDVLPVNGVFGDRANSRILDCYFETARRGPTCIELLDATTIDIWMRGVLVPFYMRGAGISDFRKSGTPHTHFTIGSFNGLGWILPVFYNAANLCPPSPLKDNLMACVERWSRWYLDFERKWPGAGFAMSRVKVDRNRMYQGPHDSLAEAGLMDGAQAEWGGGAWEHYTFYANAVAARVTGAAELQNQYERKKSSLGHGSDEELRVWLVDADREPI